jgi:hypothetical protein
MDRPEWVAVNRRTGEVFATLTNNTRRGTLPASTHAVDGSSAGSSARPPTDRVNPRASNIYGHIVRWKDDGGDPASLTFRWNVFVLAGDPAQADPARQGSIDGDLFGCPDGLWVDDTGMLWIQTDVSPARLPTGGPDSQDPEFGQFGNNQMLMADPSTGRIRRFLTGPVKCEVTGPHDAGPQDDVRQHPASRRGGIGRRSVGVANAVLVVAGRGDGRSPPVGHDRDHPRRRPHDRQLKHRWIRGQATPCQTRTDHELHPSPVPEPHQHRRCSRRRRPRVAAGRLRSRAAPGDAGLRAS